MNSKIKNILIPLAVVLVLGIQQLKAQKVTKSNGIEYIEDNSTDDLSTIKVPEKKTVKSKKITKNKKLNKNIRTIADLQRIVQNKKRLRFRNKRRTENKCYSHTDETCNTKE